jgi:hypothetical protein
VSEGVYVVLAMTVPVELGVIVAEQLEAVVLSTARVHGVPVKDPVAVPVLLNATLPVGELFVPAEETSLTWAVQVMDCEITAGDGVHDTPVAVARRVIVTAALDPLLPL